VRLIVSRLGRRPITHVVILALAILLGCGLIAASNLVLSRYEYSHLAIDGHLARIDRTTGVVEIFSKETGWADVQRLPR
jgi:hypothetical protein